MSSGTKQDFGSVRRLLKAVNGPSSSMGVAAQRIKNLGMTMRQQELNRYYSFFQAAQYEGIQVDWDGSKRVEPTQQDAIARSPSIPNGFKDVGKQTVPLKFRRPSVQYHLVRVIVKRFTGMLFGSKKHPSIMARGDEDTNEWVQGFIESTRLWAKAQEFRDLGGSMGCVAVGLKLIKGKFVIEIFDPRWCNPEFIDDTEYKLKSLEKRYMIPKEESDREGKPKIVWYWKRRVINEESDIVYRDAPVGDGDEPDWQVLTQVDHRFGFCPIVWIRNVPVPDDMDGEPDALGVHENATVIDRLLSQSSQGVLRNLDPTFLITTDARMEEIKKGSDNIIKLPAGGTGKYIEIQGTGPDAGLNMADKIRGWSQETAQVVLDHPDQAQRTATEVERAYSSMLDKGDQLREQYGENGIKPIIQMAIDIARQIEGGSFTDENGVYQTSVVIIPPKINKGKDGKETEEERVLGPGGQLEIRWPRWFQPTLIDTQAAATSVVAAKDGGLISTDQAVRFIAEFFGVENIDEMLETLKGEREEMEARENKTTGDTTASKGLLDGAEPKDLPAAREKKFAKAALPDAKKHI